MTTNDTRKFAKRFATTDRRLKAVERAAQTGFRSVEVGQSIDVTDDTGTTVGQIGGQPDGTVGVVDLVSTAPVAPTDPEVEPGVEQLAVLWDGGFVEEQPSDVTVAYVGVHVVEDLDAYGGEWEPSVESELQQITPGGGVVVLPGAAGVDASVVLVAVSAAGVWSEPTEPVIAIPTYAVTPADLPEPPPPVVPPTDAPVLAVSSFAVGSLLLTWSDVDGAEWFDVYASLTPGFDSDDLANRQLTGVAGREALVAAIGGVQIPMGVPIYVAVKPVNSAGEGPVSNEASGVAREADAEFLSALFGWFGTIEAQAAILGSLNVIMNVDVNGVISIGKRITIADADAPDGKGGIVIWGDDAHTFYVARFHPDGNYLDGILVAQDITVIQALRLIGNMSSVSSGARLKLENGTADPTAPTLSAGPILNNWPAIPSGYAERGLCWDATNGQWWQLLWRTSNSRAYVRTISTAGVAASVVLLAADWDTDETLTVVNSITFLAGSLYVFQRYAISGGSKYWRITRYSTAGAVQSGSAAFLIDTSPTSISPCVGNDGVSILWTEPSTGAASAMNIKKIAAALTGTITVRDIDVTPIPDDGRRTQSLLAGDFDRATPLVALLDTAGTVRHFANPAGVWAGEAMAPAAANDFLVDDLAYVVWKSSHAVAGEPVGFYSSASNAKLTRYSGYFPAAGEKWWAQYVDKGAGGLHTGASPESAGLAVPARRYVTVALNPAPAGVTGSDVYVGYGATTPGTTKYIRTEALAGRTMTLTSEKVTAGVQVARVITNKVLTTNVATLTSANHAFIVGDIVVVAGVDATFDGTYTITAVTTNTFSYAKVNANVASAAATGTASATNIMGGSPAELYDAIQTTTIGIVALTSNIATMNTHSPHGLAVGQVVFIRLEEGHPHKDVYDGIYTISAVISPTHFQYAKVHADIAAEFAQGVAEVPYNRWRGNGVIELPGLRETTPITGTFVVEAGGVFAIAEQLLYRVGKVVHAYLVITRASGFSTSFVNCATIPTGFKPSATKSSPTSIIALPGTAVYYRFASTSAGKVTVGQSAANGNAMILHETWLTNDAYP